MKTMIQIITRLFWSVVFLTAVVICCTALEADAAAKTIELRLLDFEAGFYTGRNYDPYLNREAPKGLTDDGSGIAVEERLSMTPRARFNFDLWCDSNDEMCFYFNNQIIGKSTDHQYRLVSWVIDTGMSWKSFDLFFQHLSSHCLECEPIDRPVYPNENWAGIRFNLYLNPRVGRTSNWR